MAILDRLRQILNDRGSSMVFNALVRDAIDELGTITFSNLNLRDFDMTDFCIHKIHFTGCVFEKVRWGEIKNTLFLKCSLINCEFSRSRTARVVRAAYSDLEFFECSISGVKVKEVELHNFEFNRCSIDGRLLFSNSIAAGYFRILQCDFGANSDVRDLSKLFMSGIESNSFVMEPHPGTNRNKWWDGSRWHVINWKTIRTLEKLPFLQVSIITIIFYWIMAEASLYLQNFYSDSCVTDITFNRSTCIVVKRLQEVSSRFGDFSFWFPSVCLLIATFCHKLFCPPIVSQYSPTEWSEGLDRPEILYRLASQLNGVALCVTLVCYGFAAFFFLRLLGMRLLVIVFH